MKHLRTWCALGLSMLSLGLKADEGFWRADALPLETMQKRYQAAPDTALINKLQSTSLRLSNGCSASIVSASGLVLTNRHCLRSCLARLSGHQNNLLRDGYSASSEQLEQSCPSLMADQLSASQDITQELKRAGDNSAQVRARLIQQCRAAAPHRHCEIVERSERDQQILLSYTRHRDLRLVFAPESAISRHQGIKSFPRYALDFALLRIWQDSNPLANSAFLPLQAKGPEANALLLMSGFPAYSERIHSSAELESLTGTVLPHQIEQLSVQKQALARLTNIEQSPALQLQLSSLNRREQNLRIQLALLSNEDTQQRLNSHAKELGIALKKNRSTRKLAKSYWGQIEALEARYQELYAEYHLIERLDGFQSQRYAMARQLVRAAIERDKADEQRLPEFQAAALPKLTQALFASEASSQEADISSLQESLNWLIRKLGAEHPIVILALADQPPEQRAEDLIRNSQIDDPLRRRQLWETGLSGLEQSQDVLVKLAWQLESFSRDIRHRFEAVQTQREQNRRALAQAMWQAQPEQAYPPPADEHRIAYGQIRGWTDDQREIFATTSFGGFLTRLGASDGSTHANWATAANEFDLSTAVNFVSDHDSVPGHSGSPIVNLKGELVGLVYDTNSYGLAGQYLYDERYNRAVSVHPAMIKRSLQDVYKLDRLVDELFPEQ